MGLENRAWFTWRMPTKSNDNIFFIFIFFFIEKERVNMGLVCE